MHECARLLALLTKRGFKTADGVIVAELACSSDREIHTIRGRRYTMRKPLAISADNI